MYTFRKAPPRKRWGLFSSRCNVSSHCERENRHQGAVSGVYQAGACRAVGSPAEGRGVKFDGYRIQVHIANDAVKILTRRGHDWTSRFKKIATDAWRINARSAIIDGEVVAPAADGVSDFSVLQKEIRAKKSDNLVMYAF
jgi:bifunctional non-homologous end joining protein LigD